MALSPWSAVGIVALDAIATTAFTVALVWKVLPPVSVRESVLVVYTVPLVTFLTTAFGWVLVAAGLYGLTTGRIDGEGSFGRTLAVVGWGRVPAILHTVVAFPYLYVWVAGREWGVDAAILAQQLRDLAAGTHGPGTLGLLVASLAWQAYIWGRDWRRHATSSGRSRRRRP